MSPESKKYSVIVMYGVFLHVDHFSIFVKTHRRGIRSTVIV